MGPWRVLSLGCGRVAEGRLPDGRRVPFGGEVMRGCLPEIIQFVFFNDDVLLNERMMRRTIGVELSKASGQKQRGPLSVALHSVRFASPARRQ